MGTTLPRRAMVVDHISRSQRLQRGRPLSLSHRQKDAGCASLAATYSQNRIQFRHSKIYFYFFCFFFMQPPNPEVLYFVRVYKFKNKQKTQKHLYDSKENLNEYIQHCSIVFFQIENKRNLGLKNLTIFFFFCHSYNSKIN